MDAIQSPAYLLSGHRAFTLTVVELFNFKNDRLWTHDSIFATNFAEEKFSREINKNDTYFQLVEFR